MLDFFKPKQDNENEAEEVEVEVVTVTESKEEESKPSAMPKKETNITKKRTKTKTKTKIGDLSAPKPPNKDNRKVLLRDCAQEMYLNYSLSVITSRAIPDVRDGLKPVQRRILYCMYNDLRLEHDKKYRKSAAIVGAVLGRYHPHGDASSYSAMVRMAQDFSLGCTLVDGHGNFGSIDGDNAAAPRYTEARLTKVASEFLKDIKKNTVTSRPNYDGTTTEPVVLPTAIPNLLVNGCTGIAVGMATSIPSHSLKETVSAAIHLLDNPDCSVADLTKHVGGPDFPTGGIIIDSPTEITQVYEKGQGSFTVRSRHHEETEGKLTSIIITEIPYAQNKSTLIEKIAKPVIENELPQVTDIRDESTDTIRIVLELKKGSDPKAVLAYLLKHTPLEQKFHVNMTCLVPNQNPLVAFPKRLNLLEVLAYFLEFRKEVVTKRLLYDVEVLEKRIHLLEGYVKVFADLDQALAVIRASKSKVEARQILETTFQLDEIQAEAVLATKIYRLVSFEVDELQEEYDTKVKERAQLLSTISSDKAIQSIIREELIYIRNEYGRERRTTLMPDAHTYEYREEDFIEDEDVHLIVTRGGWVRTQKSYGDLSSLRCKEGDEIGWIHKSNTKDIVIFFTSLGRAYTTRVADLPLTTGHGDPVQSLFQFGDGEKVVQVIVNPNPSHELVSVTRSGLGVRTSLESFLEPSTVVGRAYHRLEDTEVLNACIMPSGSQALMMLASSAGQGLTLDASTVSFYKGAGKGVRTLNLREGDSILAFDMACEGDKNKIVVETSRNAIRTITSSTYPPKKRGSRGHQIINRGTLTKWDRAVEIHNE